MIHEILTLFAIGYFLMPFLYRHHPFAHTVLIGQNVLFYTLLLGWLTVSFLSVNNLPSNTVIAAILPSLTLHNFVIGSGLCISMILSMMFLKPFFKTVKTQYLFSLYSAISISALIGLQVTQSFLLKLILIDFLSLLLFLYTGFFHHKRSVQLNALIIIIELGVGSLCLWISSALFTMPAHLLSNTISQSIPSLHFNHLAIALLIVGVWLKLAIVPCHHWFIKTISAPLPSLLMIHGIILPSITITLFPLLKPMISPELNLILSILLSISILYTSFHALISTHIRPLMVQFSASFTALTGLSILLLPSSAPLERLFLTHSLTITLLFMIGSVMVVFGFKKKLTDITGLGRQYPLLGITGLFLCLSLCQLPFSLGFAHTRYLISSALTHSLISITFSLTALLVVFGTSAIIGLRLCRALFFSSTYSPSKSTQKAESSELTLLLPSYAQLPLLCLGSILLILLIKVLSTNDQSISWTTLDGLTLLQLCLTLVSLFIFASMQFKHWKYPFQFSKKGDLLFFKSIAILNHSSNQVRKFLFCKTAHKAYLLSLSTVTLIAFLLCYLYLPGFTVQFIPTSISESLEVLMMLLTSVCCIKLIQEKDHRLQVILASLISLLLSMIIALSYGLTWGIVYGLSSVTSLLLMGWGLIRLSIHYTASQLIPKKQRLLTGIIALTLSISLTMIALFYIANSPKPLSPHYLASLTPLKSLHLPPILILSVTSLCLLSLSLVSLFYKRHSKNRTGSPPVIPIQKESLT